MSIFGVDIDNTLYDFETPARQKFLELANERNDKSLFRGLYVPWVEWRSPADVCGNDTWIEVVDRVHDDNMILIQEPFEDSVETLQYLSQNHEIIYISNRHTERYDATLEWLKKNQFPDGELICKGFEDKRNELAKCQYLIDDRPKTLVEFVYDYDWRNKYGNLKGCQRKAFGLMFENNRALTDIPNVYLAPTWKGLRYYLDEKIIEV